MANHKIHRNKERKTTKTTNINIKEEQKTGTLKNQNIEKLANEHWIFIKNLLELTDTKPTEREEYLFKEAFRHGYKHAQQEFQPPNIRPSTAGD